VYARHQFDAAVASPSPEEIKETAERVASIDLSAMTRRLMTAADGPKWSEAEARWAEARYRRFLMMARLYPGRALVPTREIDLFWHDHILNTRAYWRDCETLFGRYLHHDAGFGSLDADAPAKAAFEDDTARCYRALFGEDYFRPEGAANCTIPSCIVPPSGRPAAAANCTIPSCIVPPAAQPQAAANCTIPSCIVPPGAEPAAIAH
jgi:hypothetical protein